MSQPLEKPAPLGTPTSRRGPKRTPFAAAAADDCSKRRSPKVRNRNDTGRVGITLAAPSTALRRPQCSPGHACRAASAGNRRGPSTGDPPTRNCGGSARVPLGWLARFLDSALLCPDEHSVGEMAVGAAGRSAPDTAPGGGPRARRGVRRHGPRFGNSGGCARTIRAGRYELACRAQRVRGGQCDLPRRISFGRPRLARGSRLGSGGAVDLATARGAGPAGWSMLPGLVIR